MYIEYIAGTHELLASDIRTSKDHLDVVDNELAIADALRFGNYVKFVAHELEGSGQDCCMRLGASIDGIMKCVGNTPSLLLKYLIHLV